MRKEVECSPVAALYHVCNESAHLAIETKGRALPKLSFPILTPFLIRLDPDRIQ